MFPSQVGDPVIEGLGSAPDRAALATALASVAGDVAVHHYVAYEAAQRWPRAALEVMLPRADAATIERLIADRRFAYERQTPMPSKMVFVDEPLEVHKVPDGTKLVVRGTPDDALVDAVLAAVGPALVAVRVMEAPAWSDPAWRRLDRGALRRLHFLASDPAMVRSLLDGATALEQLECMQDSLDDDRVPGTLRSLRLKGVPDQRLRESLAHTLARCPGLDNLWIDVELDDAAVAMLASLPLVDFMIWNGRCGDDGAGALARCQTLEQLIVHGGTIGDDGAEAVATLPALRRLWLDRHRVGARGAAAIASMTTLEELQLDDNLIDDAGAAVLARLRGLRALSLIGNPIHDPEALRPTLAAAARDVKLVSGDRTDGFGAAY